MKEFCIFWTGDGTDFTCTKLDESAVDQPGYMVKKEEEKKEKHDITNQLK